MIQDHNVQYFSCFHDVSGQFYIRLRRLEVRTGRIVTERDATGITHFKANPKICRLSTTDLNRHHESIITGFDLNTVFFFDLYRRLKLDFGEAVFDFYGVRFWFGDAETFYRNSSSTQ